ncbi:MAG: hypothetical protein LBO62_04215 [Endomicrobium sp.]|jgi:Tfp pilus assembly protein PilE|nr:hypothetical protein [Endomicrobium sp.]
MNATINSRGVSITEITVVIVIAMLILGIFAMNRTSQLEIAYREEARVFIHTIAEKEKIFYASHNEYLTINTSTDAIEELGIYLGRNEYFGSVTVVISTAAPFTVFNPQVTVTLYGKNKMQDKTVKGVYDFISGKLNID